MASRSSNLKQKPPTVFTITRGPSRWDLASAMVGEDRHDRRAYFTVKVAETGAKRFVKISVRLTMLRIPDPEDSRFSPFDDQAFFFEGTADQFGLLKTVSGEYDLRHHSGTLTIS